MGARKSGNPYLLLVVAAVVVVLALIPLLLAPPQSAGYWVMRGAALMGYQVLFLAVVSSLFLRQMLRWFGRPFLKVHHWAVIVGLALVTLHPITVAIVNASARFFLPRFDSLRMFLTYGGAPALYLFIIATLVAIYRKALGPRWKQLHWLAYLALVVASVHAALLGDSFFSLPALRVVPALLAISALAAFVYKQRQAAKRPTPTGRPAR